MTLIVCVDDDMGMAFNRRRVSRDSAVSRDIAALADGRRIRMHSRSAMLFEDTGASIAASDDFAQRVEAGEVCFVEFESVRGLADRAGALVLYRWNRRYPADLRFDAPLEAWRLAETTEFPGSSHERITREVYVRE